MYGRRYKLYLASGIKLWTLRFKDEYAPFFNNKVDLFQPALIDQQYLHDHRKIPIRIATKDLGEIDTCDAILAYMKMYDTQDNGPAGTDSSWECGYAIGREKPTIMLVEDLAHLDYYSTQWMVTFSIGAVLTTSRAVADVARNHDKFTHAAILHCENKREFENKIIEYLDEYYRSVYAREGMINYSVDKELRRYADGAAIAKILEESKKYGARTFDLDVSIFESNRTTFDAPPVLHQICNLEFQRARTVRNLIHHNFDDLIPFLYFSVSKYLRLFEGKESVATIAKMIEYWLSIPAKEIRGRKQGRKKTRPTIFFELHDLVSHHIVASERLFGGNFVYQVGAILEIYNWLNTYAIDDVLDNSETRQGEQTLHVKFGSRKSALLLGAIGHCLSLILLYERTEKRREASEQLLSALNDVQYVMYLGQRIDIDLSFNSRKALSAFIKRNTLESALRKYFSRIYGICGAFYEEIGRMAVKSTNVGAQFYNQDEVENACIYIAKLFGLVQMIRNDLGDFVFPERMPGLSKGLKNTSHNDITEGKVTLPTIYSIFGPHTDKRDRTMLLKFVGDRTLSPRDKREVSRIIWESGSIGFTMQFIEHFSALVRKQYITHINETPTRLRWILKLMDITPLVHTTFQQMAIEHQWRRLEPQGLTKQMIGDVHRITERENFLAGNMPQQLLPPNRG